MAEALIGYPTVFFAIWWAWMNFTWFASAYDNDDVAYRLAVLVQIAGVLILAAGVPRAFDDRDFAVVTLGYAVMRVALVAQWLRAARDDPGRRRTDRRYAAGSASAWWAGGSCCWSPSPVRPFGFVLMVAAELAVPIWAERAAPTTWHPHHITERYGLFTLIVLGESVAAASVGVQSGLDAGDGTRPAPGHRGGRPPHRVLDVVDLLRAARHPRRRGSQEHVRDHQLTPVVPVGLRPLRGVHLGRRRSAPG